MTKIAIGKLAEQVILMPIGNTIDFSCLADDDYIWGIIKIRLLDSNLVVLGIYGGGMTFMYDLTCETDSAELADFITRSLPLYAEGNIWLK